MQMMQYLALASFPLIQLQTFSLLTFYKKRLKKAEIKFIFKAERIFLHVNWIKG